MFTFNGIGTKLIGKQDTAPDGSFVTTKWFVLVFLPVRYLGTYRVKVLPPESNWEQGTRYEMVQLPKDHKFARNILLIYWSVFSIVMMYSSLRISNYHGFDISLAYDSREHLMGLLHWIIIAVIFDFGLRRANAPMKQK
jgi:hypothetical protein